MTDTYTVTVHQDDFSFPNNEEFNWTEEQIKVLVNYAIENYDVGISKQNQFKEFATSEINSGISFSRAAYIESESGYFIISEDMMLHLNVVYSRWD
ncbi:hypothetical protein [Pseudoalteromonas carrageenovora]|uniref:hypothetical protein n=1 Tax=Pseudoalteromonas carrageenovora TaxID=227 RepID=UPI0026E2A013|nr:hypothetical protein [Pseudoalteromonas carrageenovora]MDO6547318.1 hypothetical protein [Pseudoalteromonas carrageenovora]MDO6831766.1 hypothetical protein [Pseudoalteromonas carrageenovora]